ncbi:MAG: DUF368 domain-containing protein [Epsilonproteobacteria bacterium]|nr:MAG: DUF368 domain-containing protein [Campylobacterota bacterium]RLA64493.1 MAG: DUF368 domain-containing protein [Campylobacterota bacterium]
MLKIKEIWNQNPGPSTKKEYATLTFKGMMMGVADLVPGVSGGTIAYITGIYEDLINAIHTIDHEVLKSILSLDFKTALGKINFRFLVPLFGGILFSVFAFARLMHHLIMHHPEPTWGVFFGLICGSIFILANEVKEHPSFSTFFWMLLGTLFGYGVVNLIPVTTPSNLWFVFLCGIISITAMILPGLSGSFLLLILGKYEFITNAVKNPFNEGNFIILLVFTLGTVTGLISFSKILHYFLKRFHYPTRAFLTGLLIGSLPKIWPFKQVLESKVIRGKVRVIQDMNIWPDIDSQVVYVFALMVISLIGILILERKANGKKA